MTQPHFSRTQLRRAVLSSYLGSVIEWYDFQLYGAAAALVLRPVVLPDGRPGRRHPAGVLHLRDRVRGPAAGGDGLRPLRRPDRPEEDVGPLAMMGVAARLIGLLPTYARSASWPRSCYPPAAPAGRRGRRRVGRRGALAVEHAPRSAVCWAASPARRPAGTCCRRVLAVALLCRRGEFLAWGWRIPFLLSIVLVGVGLFVLAQAGGDARVRPRRRARRSPRGRRCSRCCATTRATCCCPSASASAPSSRRPPSRPSSSPTRCRPASRGRPC